MMLVVALLLSFLSFSGFTRSTQVASVKAQTTLLAIKSSNVFKGITYQQALTSGYCNPHFSTGFEIKNLFRLVIHSTGAALLLVVCILIYRGIKEQLLYRCKERRPTFADLVINL